MTGLREKGVLVPRDKSIVGFDDNYLCQLTNPNLTTIHQDAGQKGILAVDMLLKELRHEPQCFLQILNGKTLSPKIPFRGSFLLSVRGIAAPVIIFMIVGIKDLPLEIQCVRSVDGI